MLGSSLLGYSLLGAYFDRAGNGLPTDPVTPSPTDPRDWVYDPTIDKPVPTSFDLLAYSGLAEDQKTTNSCLANATVSAMEILLSRSKAFKDLSRLFLYWHLRKDTPLAGGDNGAYPRDGFKVASYSGVCNETTWPFDPAAVNLEPNERATLEATELKAYGYYSIACKRTTTLEQIKFAIASGYPVVVSHYTSQSFMNISGLSLAGTIGTFVPASQSSSLGGHATVAMGYTSDGYLLIENSWGSDWGYNGYAYLPAEQFLTDVFEAWVCTGLNGATIPSLLERTKWHFETTLPTKPTLRATATNNPQNNLASLAMSSGFVVEGFGGANSSSVLSAPTLDVSASFTVVAGSSLRCPRPMLSITASFATAAYADLTFGEFRSGNFQLSAYSGGYATVKAPSAEVLGRAVTGGVGRFSLVSSRANTSAFAGGYAALMSPLLRLSVISIRGNEMKLVAPRTTIFAGGGRIPSGSVSALMPAPLTSASSGGAAVIPANKPVLTASALAGSISSARLTAPRAEFGGFWGARAHIQSVSPTVSASMSLRLPAVILGSMPSPVVKANSGARARINAPSATMQASILNGVVGRGKTQTAFRFFSSCGGHSRLAVKAPFLNAASSSVGVGAANVMSPLCEAAGSFGGHFRGVLP